MHVDDSPLMGAFRDFLGLVEGLDRKKNAPILHLYHACIEASLHSEWGCRKMSDVHLSPNGVLTI